MSSAMSSPGNLKRSAFLFLTDKESEPILSAYKDLEKAMLFPDKAYVLFHQKNTTLTQQMEKLAPFLFTYKSLLDLNYVPIVMDIIPGSNHFPVLQFFLEFPDYDYYWVIEDDVRFSGDWRFFFDHFDTFGHDFISSHLRTYSQEPVWAWWKHLSHSSDVIPFNKRIRSFNPIYRISGQALHFIHRCLRNKWTGHHEVLLPTLLHHNGFKILDFGGQGDFVRSGNDNKFYTSSTTDPKGNLNEGTMRFRPIWKAPGDEKNKLYHPVK